MIIALLTASLLAQAPLRPPATPLITHHPYFSLWSGTDRLATETRHWTGTAQPLSGVIRIDGKPYRFLGAPWRWGEPFPEFPQKSRTVTPTRTTYTFEGQGVALEVTFLTPVLVHDLDLVSRPVTYLTFNVKPTGAQLPRTQVWFDAAANIAVNHSSEPVELLSTRFNDIEALRLGSRAQPILQKSGDDLRIDWGYFYLAAPASGGVALHRTNTRDRLTWLEKGALQSGPEPNYSDRLVHHAAALLDFTAAGSKTLILAYDELYAVEYFGRRLRPYWRRNGASAETMITQAAREQAKLTREAEAFDAGLTKRLLAAGGPEYAAIAILAYRQTLAAHVLAADTDGTPLYFSKENFSNGCIGTVDVTYPSAPFFLALNPQLLKAQLRFIMDYASMARWPWPYPPHDIGQYPLANGQVYGGQEQTEFRQMPVEESGNMILLLAALAKAEGNADFSRRYWPLITKWAKYLEQKGLDPDNQLSTDDFAGHLAHNTNLSLKAITALGAYHQLAKQLGQPADANVARNMAKDWIRMARDGDHYKLTFDKPGTWSQKYNLVWDRLLSLDLFPPEVARDEVAYYIKIQKKYGVPLDNRNTYTKLDWIVWSATLATGRESFQQLIAPVWRFLNESPSRVPMTDWYFTDSGEQRGFQARSVVGGVYIKLLADQWRP